LEVYVIVSVIHGHTNVKNTAVFHIKYLAAYFNLLSVADDVSILRCLR